METPDFPRCPGHSPACLGMVKFDCCGTQALVGRLDKEIENEEKAAATERKRKSLSLPQPSKKLAPSSASRFNTTTDAEVQEAAKESVQGSEESLASPFFQRFLKMTSWKGIYWLVATLRITTIFYCIRVIVNCWR